MSSFKFGNVDMSLLDIWEFDFMLEMSCLPSKSAANTNEKWSIG